MKEFVHLSGFAAPGCTVPVEIRDIDYIPIGLFRDTIPALLKLVRFNGYISRLQE